VCKCSKRKSSDVFAGKKRPMIGAQGERATEWIAVEWRRRKGWRKGKTECIMENRNAGSGHKLYATFTTAKKGLVDHRSPWPNCPSGKQEGQREGSR
jgi:hypothetical protein